MRLPHELWSATCLLSLAQLTFAFYPYQPHYSIPATSALPTNAVSSSRRSALKSTSAVSSLSFRLRRILRPRDNEYDILEAKTPTQKNAVGVSQDGTDYTYMAALLFGSSDEEFNLLLDSAASDTWVMGATCTAEACLKHNTLGRKVSSSLDSTTETFSITYGSGKVSGTWASDTVKVGDIGSIPLTFGLGTNVSDDFLDYPMDGILALGRGERDNPSLVEALSAAFLISSKVYGVHLSRDADGLNDGELDFGAPNPAFYDGDLAYVDIVDNADGFWEIPMDDAGVAGGDWVGLTGRTAIIDTGTSFVLAPPADAKALHDLVSGSSKSGETYTVPCDTTQDLALKFGGITYNISYQDYVGDKVASGQCGSRIIGRQTFGSTEWLVGDVFLKNVYTVFDLDQSRVGFGVAAADASVSTTQAPVSASSTGGTSAASTAALSSADITVSGTATTTKTTISSAASSSAGSTGTETATPLAILPSATGTSAAASASDTTTTTTTTTTTPSSSASASSSSTSSGSGATADDTAVFGLLVAVVAGMVLLG